MEQRKRLLSKELIAFKKNAVIVENLDKDFSKKPKEEILDFFSERPYVVALQNELMNLGYMIELNALAALTEEDAKRISCNVLSYAQDLLGADHDWKPLYGGFPAQVQDMSEIELLIDQIVHYMSMGTWMPSVPKKYQDMKNKDVFDCPSYVTLKGISYDDFLNIFYSICGSKNSITPFDKESIEWFLANKKEELDILTMSIPFKENLCIFLDQYPEFVESSSTTINDILRTIVYRQGGDITLPALPKKMVKDPSYVWSNKKIENPERESFKFKKMTRAERRYFLEMIEKKVSLKGVTACVLDARKYQGRWIRLGEILHPGQYASRYENAFKFFDELRNNKMELKSWNSHVLDLYRKLGGKKENCDMRNIIAKVSERPGEFIRRFDSIYRRSDLKSKDALINAMCSLEGAASKTLIEFYTHIDKRTKSMPRFVTTPGSRKRTSLPELTPLAETEVKSIKGAIMKALVNTLSTKESWTGKTVVLDSDLAQMYFPTDMRTLNEGKLTIPRGYKIPFKEIGPNNEDTVRFYAHWYDPHGTIDLDLHGYFVSEDYKKSESVGWNTCNKNTVYATYSGDVRHVVGDCAEYIDVRVKDAIAHGWRYVLLNLNSFSGQHFNTMEANFGFTYRKKPQEDKTWKPKQVVQQIKLTSKSQNICCALIDLKEQWIKVIDFDWDGIPVANIYSNRFGDYCKFYATNPELNLELMLKLNALARKADKVISLEDYDKMLQELEEKNAVRRENGEEELGIDTSDYIVFKAQDFVDDYTKILNLV